MAFARPLPASSPSLPAGVEDVVQRARLRWLDILDVCLVLDNLRVRRDLVQTSPPLRPQGGSLFVVAKNRCRRFRRDGYVWQHRVVCGKKLPHENHMRLRAQGRFVQCYYSYPVDKTEPYRRVYWLEDHREIVLIHYLAQRPPAAAPRAPPASLPHRPEPWPSASAAPRAADARGDAHEGPVGVSETDRIAGAISPELEHQYVWCHPLVSFLLSETPVVGSGVAGAVADFGAGGGAAYGALQPHAIDPPFQHEIHVAPAPFAAHAPPQRSFAQAPAPQWAPPPAVTAGAVGDPVPQPEPQLEAFGAPLQFPGAFAQAPAGPHPSPAPLGAVSLPATSAEPQAPANRPSAGDQWSVPDALQSLGLVPPLPEPPRQLDSPISAFAPLWEDSVASPDSMPSLSDLAAGLDGYFSALGDDLDDYDVTSRMEDHTLDVPNAGASLEILSDASPFTRGFSPPPHPHSSRPTSSNCAPAALRISSARRKRLSALVAGLIASATKEAAAVALPASRRGCAGDGSGASLAVRGTRPAVSCRPARRVPTPCAPAGAPKSGRAALSRLDALSCASGRRPGAVLGRLGALLRRPPSSSPPDDATAALLCVAAYARLALQHAPAERVRSPGPPLLALARARSDRALERPVPRRALPAAA